jgi:hypothetical protein
MMSRKDDDLSPNGTSRVNSITDDVDFQSSVFDSRKREESGQFVFGDIDFSVRRGREMVRRRRGRAMSSWTVMRTPVRTPVRTSVRRRRRRSIFWSGCREFVPNPLWKAREPTRARFRSLVVFSVEVFPIYVDEFSGLVLRNLRRGRVVDVVRVEGHVGNDVVG